jgi:hypothetical protein
MALAEHEGVIASLCSVYITAYVFCPEKNGAWHEMLNWLWVMSALFAQCSKVRKVGKHACV